MTLGLCYGYMKPGILYLWIIPEDKKSFITSIHDEFSNRLNHGSPDHRLKMIVMA